MDAKDMGRKGGRSRSAAKRTAARRNGKRGGRPRQADVFARQVTEECRRLAPQLPRIDPGDLRLIVRCMLLPPGGERLLVAALADIIRSKQAAGRAKDRAVVPILRDALAVQQKRER